MGTLKFMGETMKDAAGLEEVAVRSYAMRAGDQSFYGIGVPSVAVRARIPEGSPLRGVWIGGSGGGWWWHSAYDTLDKGDRENLLRDLRMEALTILRAANCAVLLFDFAQVAEQYEEALIELQTKTASGTFNLNPVLDEIRDLKSRSEVLNDAIADLKETSDKEKVKKVNKLLMKASRILTSTLYTYGGKYDQDPAYGIPLLPALQQVTELSSTDPESSEAGFLRTKIVRQMNKVNDKLGTAEELIDAAIEIAK